MKRILVGMCICILVILNVSCKGGSNGFVVYEDGSASDRDGSLANHKAEILLEYTLENPEKNMKTKQMTVDGKTVIAEYEKTVSSPYYTDGEIEYYRYSDGNSFYSWGIEPSTDRTVCYSWGSSENANKQYEEKNHVMIVKLLPKHF